MRLFRLPAALAALTASAAAIQMDVTNDDSIKSAMKTVAGKMLEWYTGNKPGGTPGILPDPYYWYEAGEMMGTLIHYWYYTGDTEYNDLTTEAMVFQISPTYDYMPANQTKNEGNDDQVFWGFAAMSAAELQYPEPPAPTPAWISLAAAVFNSQWERWDTTLCGGGLRWQIFQWNNGWNYKNTVANAGFLNLAARLYLYTGNETYADSVIRSWNWMSEVGLIGSNYNIYDGTDATQNCSSLDHHQWTYSAGMLINAASVMWNATSDNSSNPAAGNSSMWQTRAQGIWNSSSIFFQNKVMYEAECEPPGNCDLDQQSFKRTFSRFLAASVKVAPFLYDQVQPYLAASATAAAAQCSGGTDKITCGTKWTTNGVWDGTSGVGQQMCALEVIGANLVQKAAAPVTQNTGGVKGNSSLGGGSGSDSNGQVPLAPITTADKAGAGILTAVVIVGLLSGGWWIVS